MPSCCLGDKESRPLVLGSLTLFLSQTLMSRYMPSADSSEMSIARPCWYCSTPIASGWHLLSGRQFFHRTKVMHAILLASKSLSWQVMGVDVICLIWHQGCTNKL